MCPLISITTWSLGAKLGQSPLAPSVKVFSGLPNVVLGSGTLEKGLSRPAGKFRV